MRRFILLLTPLLVITTLVNAQRPERTLPASTTPSEPIVLPDDLPGWELMVSGLYEPVELEPVSMVRGSRAADDNCPAGDENLPDFNVSADGTTYLASDLTVVNGYTVEESDPLVCATDADFPTRGFRTAWYKFVAPATGQLTVTTLPNFSYRENYDTILTVLGGNSCEEARPLACNDDANGLLSEVNLQVAQGQTYFIEVADYNLEVSGEAKLSLQVRIDSADFTNTDPAWNTLAARRSRHVSKVIDDKIYVFGGQTVVDATTPVRTGRTDVFDPADGTWSSRAAMLGVCADKGYSNVDAVYFVNEDEDGNTTRKVYFPSGYVGDTEIHSGIHCVYDVDRNIWTTGTNAPFLDNDAPIYTSILKFDRGFFVVGGLLGRFLDSSDGNTSSDVYFYDVTNDLWSINAPIPALPGGRYAHTGITLYNQFLCVTGGLRSENDANLLLTDSLCLNTNAPGNGWETIAGLNVPRFNASSALGEDGSWIVYGGIDQNQDAVSEIEVYDFADNQWVVLDDRFDIDNPARAWAEGGVVNGDLYAIGGEADIAGGFGGFITPLVERVADIPLINPTGALRTFLPLSARDYLLRQTLDSSAIELRPGNVIEGNFNAVGDRLDVYAVTLPEEGMYSFVLNNVPRGDNYDLYLYLEDKTLLDSSQNVGNSNEAIAGILPAGRFYLFVVAEENTTPDPTGNYRLSIIAQ